MGNWKTGQQVLGLGVLALAQAAFMVRATGAGISLPDMARTLHLSVAELQWVLRAYSLPFGALPLAAARFGRTAGARRAFGAGIAVFTVGSLFAGLAGSLVPLLAFTAVQGVGAGIATGCALGLVADAFPAGRARNIALGVYFGAAAVFGAASVLIGGALADWFSWRAIYLAIACVSGIILLATPVAFPVSARVRTSASYVPAVVSGVTLALLVYGLSRAADGVWTDGWLLAAVLGLGAQLWVYVAGRRERLPPGHAGGSGVRRVMVGAFLVVALLSASYFGMLALLNLQMQDLQGMSLVQAGWRLLPAAVAALAGAVALPPLARWGGLRLAGVIASVVAVIGLWWLAASVPASAASAGGGTLIPMLLVSLAAGDAIAIAIPAAMRTAGTVAELVPADMNAARNVGVAAVVPLVLNIFASVTLSSAATAHSNVLLGLHDGIVAGFRVTAACAILALVVAVVALPGRQPVDGGRPAS
jgi:MFS family permease